MRILLFTLSISSGILRRAGIEFVGTRVVFVSARCAQWNAIFFAFYSSEFRYNIRSFRVAQTTRLEYWNSLPATLSFSIINNHRARSIFRIIRIYNGELCGKRRWDWIWNIQQRRRNTRSVSNSEQPSFSMLKFGHDSTNILAMYTTFIPVVTSKIGKNFKTIITL